MLAIPPLNDDEFLCVMPITRLRLEDTVSLGRDVTFHPPGDLTPRLLRVVGWPERDFEEALSRGQGDVAWYASAATGVTLEDFFSHTLVSVRLDMDWGDFLEPKSHEEHMRHIERGISKVERVLDLVRYCFCDITVPQMLPGRAGLLERSNYTSALFYSPRDHESYIIAGEVVRQRIIGGVGLDGSDLHLLPDVEEGDVGSIFTHATRLLSDAMEASTDTSRFVQMMSLLEFLACPTKYISMKDVKREIALHAATSKTDYDEINERFRYLSSRKDAVTEIDEGLRNNVVHCGKRIEDMLTRSEMDSIFRELQIYARAVMDDLLKHSDRAWDSIEALRLAHKARIGL